VLVFQIMLSRPLTVLANDLVYGLTCPLSKARATGIQVVTVLQLVSNTLTIIGCVRTGRAYKNTQPMRQQRAVAKLWVFKTVVLLDTTQSTVFSFAAGRGVYTPSEPYLMSWNDFAKGIPLLMLSVELVVCAICFLWVYQPKQYLVNGPPPESPFAALLQTVDPRDIVVATMQSFLPGKFAPSSGELTTRRAGVQEGSVTHHGLSAEEKQSNLKDNAEMSAMGGSTSSESSPPRPSREGARLERPGTLEAIGLSMAAI
jgi:hypothetical protein